MCWTIPKVSIWLCSTIFITFSKGNWKEVTDCPLSCGVVASSIAFATSIAGPFSSIGSSSLCWGSFGISCIYSVTFSTVRALIASSTVVISVIESLGIVVRVGAENAFKEPISYGFSFSINFWIIRFGVGVGFCLQSTFSKACFAIIQRQAVTS